MKPLLPPFLFIYFYCKFIIFTHTDIHTYTYMSLFLKCSEYNTKLHLVVGILSFGIYEVISLLPLLPVPLCESPINGSNT